MTTKTPNLFLAWHISCFDRRKEQPLPYETKWYHLDWSLLNEQQIAEVLAIVNEREKTHDPSPESFDSTVVTMRHGARGPDYRLLKYRQFFKLTNVSEMDALFGEPPKLFQSMRNVELHAEYLEDENERPISEIEVFQHITGQTHPIIFENPESVLRLGPIDAVRQDQWCKRSANMISHFLAVEGMLNGHAGIPPITEVTTLKLLNCFFYGARMLHGEPDDDAETEWMSLIATHGREKMVLAVHGAMMQVTKYSVLVYPVIRQDFEHWVRVQKLIPPDTLDPAYLLASRRRATPNGPSET